MKIMFFISTLGSGGAERALTNLAKYLHQFHEITITTFNDPKYDDFYTAAQDIRRINFFEPPTRNPAKKILSFIKTLSFIRSSVKKTQADIAISFGNETNSRVILSTIGLSIPTIISERTDPKYNPVNKLNVLLSKLAFPKASSIVVQTHSAMTYYKKKLGKQTIVIIPNAVSNFNLTSTDKNTSEHRKLIAVGRLSKEKNHRKLILAFIKHHDTHPEWELHIYGQGALKKSLKQLITSRNAEDYVILKGLEKNISKAYQNADAFVLPSVYEGFPNVLLEAMSFRLPVISTPVNGATDLISPGHNGILTRGSAEDDILQGLEELGHCTPETLEQYGSNAKKTIQDNYTDEKIFKLWDNLINKITANISEGVK
jgi:GalNAc-alpha-(1->4)-GalNAc-alpha-(1->3)-diNAcBac-PP-undecaprenol alpha-1,4-N-acetyl-D-galactosaminyltransferase